MTNQPYDLVQVNTVRQFGVIFFDSATGTEIDLNDVTIEISHICAGQFIVILQGPMTRTGTGQYVHETLITPSVYPVNQLFIVKFCGTHPTTMEEICKFETFRTIGEPILPQSNVVNIIASPVSKTSAKFNNGTNI